MFTAQENKHHEYSHKKALTKLVKTEILQ